MAEEILIVDDEPDIRSLISLMLEDEGFQTVTAANGAQARELLSARPPSCVILDIWLRDSDMDGLEILSWCQSIYPELPVLMISGHGTIETAVQAIRQGAYDFVEKPFKAERLLLTVRRALHNRKLEKENAELRQQSGSNGQVALIGQSAPINQLRQQVEKVAKTASRVMITGPSGSGKETLARLIHDHSDRADGPFVAVACARLTPERADTDLFGSENLQYGRRVVGLLEQAHRGTLYFDEVCDLPLEAQGRLVRAVAEQSFRRIGGGSEVHVDVRIISASSRDLTQEMAEKRLREDLFYRLGVVSLAMPSLAERREDIAMLAKHFATIESSRLGRPNIKFGDDLLNAMRAYHWPGAVRQLRNVVESMLILANTAEDEPLTVDALPTEIRGVGGVEIAGNNVINLALPLRDARESFERHYMEQQLQRFEGNISQMAKFIGMERSALHRKLKSLDIHNN